MRMLIVLFALCAVVRGQEPAPSAQTNTNRPTTGSISGRVVNETGQPMAGATAMVRLVNSQAFGGRTIETDADGNFTINNLSPGLYIISARAPAHTSLPPDPNNPATFYRIGDTANVRLVRGGVITGTVTNAAGEPVIAVSVRAMMVRDMNGQRPTSVFVGGGQAQTDDRGIYRMYGLLPGTYIVSAGGLSMSQTFIFNPYEYDVPTYAPSATRDTAAEVSVRSGEESNVDIRYRGDPGHVISGTVKASSASNGASVSMTPAEGSIMPTGNSFQPPGGRGFSFNGVADGEYDLLAQEFTPNQMGSAFVILVSEPRRVVVKGANVTGIELVPKPLASVSGRIVLESSKVPECQGKRPPLMAETLVQLRRPPKDPEKGSTFVRQFASSGSPDSKGEFVLRNLNVGKYQFDPRFYARYWYVQSITLPGTATTAAKSQAAPSSKTDAAANWTTVKFGDQLTNLTITLAEGAASVRGKLVSGEPTPGMVLYLVPSEPDKAADVLRFFVTEIAADGTFALNNLPPGRYWALSQSTADAQIATMTKLREPEAAPARTKLRKTAETKKAEIQLKPCQNLADYELKQ